MLHKYPRSPAILYKQFWWYLFSSVCSVISVSLNEFVDGIIVSNLLGGDALSVVNLTFPLAMVFSALAMWLGIGGSTAMGVALGASDQKKGAEIFTLTLCLTVAASIISLIFGVLFSEKIAAFLAFGNHGLEHDLHSATLILLIGGTIVLPVLTLPYFLGIEGKPGYAVAIVVVANVVNMLMDVIYIRGCGMGVEGAFLGTVTGYAIGFAVYAGLVFAKKINFVLMPLTFSLFKHLPLILTGGAAVSASIALFAVQIWVLNQLSIHTAGVEGVIIFSVCLGVNSLMSIMFAGIGEIIPSILPVLIGADDVSGQRFIIRRIFKFCLLMVAICGLGFLVFPQLVLNAYGITGEIYAHGVLSVRIFVPGMCLAALSYVWILYFQTIGHQKFAMVLSVLDNVAIALPLAWIFSASLGFMGIIWALTVTSLVMVLIILAYSAVMLKKMRGKVEGLLLLPVTSDTAKFRFEATIPFELHAAIGLSESVYEYCKQCGIAEQLAYLIQLAVEEMAVLTIRQKDKGERMDVIIVADASEVTLNFRTLGPPFNPTEIDNVDDAPENISNIVMLRKISASINFERLLMMNNVVIRLPVVG